MSFNVLRDASISKKFALAFGAALLAVCAMCAMAFNEQRRAAEAADVSTRALRALDDVDRTMAGLYDQNASLRGLSLYKEARFVGKYEAAGQMVGAAIAAAREQARDDAVVLDGLSAVAASVQVWREEIGDRAVRLAGDPATRDASVALTASARASDLINAFRDVCAKLHATVDDRSSAAQREQDAAGTAMRDALVGGTVAVLVIMLAGWAWMTRIVVGPVAAMTRAMRALAAGDRAVAIPALDRHDEVGQMGAAVQVFKDHAIRAEALEAEAAAARDAANRERSGHEADRAESARRQAEVVEGIADGLDRLSQGQLAFRLDRAFAPEYEKLRSDFNGAMTRLRDTLAVVANNGGAIRSATGEISTAADDLSRRTEHQAASLEETAAALNEITTTVKKTSAGAGHADAVVQRARANAEETGRVVRHAVDAMAGIAASSSQITQIIGVIDEIAFQTNLLALNAGVEAARAGEAGRGFAVVASEVRALAQRSASAAKEIKDLIAASRGQVERGVDLVGRTGTALQGIVDDVSEIAAAVSEIAAAAREQAQGLEQVNIAITQMDQVTQQNAAMVEESTAASHDLAREADELTRLIGHFQLGREHEAEGTRRSEPSRHRSAPPAPAATATALKTVGRGGAARKPQAADAAPDWEAF